MMPIGFVFCLGCVFGGLKVAKLCKVIRKQAAVDERLIDFSSAEFFSILDVDNNGEVDV